MNKKTVLITGASSGIGRAAAIELSQKGYSVYAGARRTEKLQELESMGIHPVFLDVADESSIESCVSGIIAKEGSIDVLINNAGYGSYGAVEDVPLSEGRYQMEALLFGMARLVQLVLPKMRESCASNTRAVCFLSPSLLATRYQKRFVPAVPARDISSDFPQNR